MVATLARLVVRILLALTCALAVASLIFAAWTTTQTGNQLPQPLLPLAIPLLPLFWISLTANTVITAREIPKDKRNPLSINAALYRRFARRSSRRVRAILAVAWVLAGALGATGIVSSTPIRLMGGVILAFYAITCAMFIALLPKADPSREEIPAP